MSNPIIKQIVNNLAESSGTDIQLIEGIKQMPISKMYEQLQYLQNHVLPQAKEKLGEKSESYQFYKGLTDSLVWAIKQHSSFEHLSLKYSRDKYVMSVLMENIDALEKELLKYTTLEKMYLNMAVDAHQQAIAKKVTT